MTPDLKIVKVGWQGANDLPVQMANVFAVQATPDGILLTIGQVSQPIFTGTPAEQEAAMARLTEVVARPLIRLAMTQERMQELFAAIGQTMFTLVENGLASPQVRAQFEELSTEATQ